MDILEHATLVLNGQLPVNKTHLAFINDSSIIIAADGSLNHLIQNKIIPHLVIGDLDSADKGLIEKYNVQSIEIKDQSKTDFEKILIWCLEKNIQKISIFGIAGKDEDHHPENTVRNDGLALRGPLRRQCCGLCAHFTSGCAKPSIRTPRPCTRSTFCYASGRNDIT